MSESSFRRNTPSAPEDPFVIVEFTEQSESVVAEGVCPESTVPESMNIEDSGRTLIACNGQDFVHVGVFSTGRRSIDWQHRVPIDLAPGRHVSGVPALAAVGDQLALVLELGAAKGAGTGMPAYAVRFVPATAALVPICADNTPCNVQLVAVLANQTELLCIVTDDVDAPSWYSQISIQSPGTVTSSDPIRSARLETGNLPGICIARDNDGVEWLSLPVPDPSSETLPPAATGPVPNVAVVSYANARLTSGPEVFPFESARCVPRDFEEAAPWPAERRANVRASRATSWVGAYSLPLLDEHSSEPAYPGTFHIRRWSDPSEP